MPIAGNDRYAAGAVSNDNVVNCMLFNALSQPLPVDYKPPCSGTGAVIMLPCLADGTIYAQATIAQIPIASLAQPCWCERGKLWALDLVSGM
jgi:hypothetical protein